MKNKTKKKPSYGRNIANIKRRHGFKTFLELRDLLLNECLRGLLSDF